LLCSVQALFPQAQGNDTQGQFIHLHPQQVEETIGVDQVEHLWFSFEVSAKECFKIFKRKVFSFSSRQLKNSMV
jgi:hypothetical protein